MQWMIVHLSEDWVKTSFPPCPHLPSLTHQLCLQNPPQTPHASRALYCDLTTMPWPGTPGLPTWLVPALLRVQQARQLPVRVPEAPRLSDSCSLETEALAAVLVST